MLNTITKKLSCLLVAALVACTQAEAASTGINTTQTVTAAPGAVNMSGVAASQGTSLGHAKADHVHSITGVLPAVNGGTGAGALTCTNQLLTSNGTAYSCVTPTLAGPQFANQGVTGQLLHGNAAGNPSWSAVNLGVPGTPDVTGNLQEINGGTGAGALTCTNQLLTSNGTTYSCVTATLASAQFVNQGTTSQVLIGNAAGNPSWGALPANANNVQHDATLSGSGTSGSVLGLSLGNANTWTIQQTFSSATANQTSAVFNGNGTGNGANFVGGNAGASGTGSNAYGINVTGGAASGGIPGPGIITTGGAGSAIGAPGLVVSSSNSSGTNIGAASAILATGGTGSGNAAGTIGGAGGILLSGTAGVGGGTATGTGGAGGAAVSVTAGAGGATTGIGTGGVGGQAGVFAAGAGGAAASTGVGGQGGLGSSFGGGTGGNAAGVGAGGNGGGGFTANAGAGGTATGAGVGGTGGIGGVVSGGNGGAVAGGTGGNGGAGFNAVGGNGAAANGSGALGAQLTGGNGVGTGTNGTGLIAQSGTGGTGTTNGLGIQITQSNSIRAHTNKNALSADPTTLNNGDEWIAGATTAMTPKVRLNGVTQPYLTGGANGARGVQTVRVSGCTTAASLNAVCNTTVTWPVAFPDANYTAVCVGDTISTNVPIIEGFNAKVAASITVVTLALTAAAAAWGTIDCVAVHD